MWARYQEKTPLYPIPSCSSWLYSVIASSHIVAASHSTRDFNMCLILPRSLATRYDNSGPLPHETEVRLNARVTVTQSSTKGVWIDCNNNNIIVCVHFASSASIPSLVSMGLTWTLISWVTVTYSTVCDYTEASYTSIDARQNVAYAHVYTQPPLACGIS